MGLDMYVNRVNKITEDQKKEYGFMKSQIKILNILTCREWCRIWREAENAFKKEYNELVRKHRSREIEFCEYLGLKSKLEHKKYEYVKVRLSKKYIERESLINKYSSKIDSMKNEKEVGYFRKHSDLHGYFGNLYRERGGEEEFNCVPLVLSKEDCEDVLQLAKNVLNGEEAEHHSGFFWGSSTEDDWKETVDVFSSILKETDFEKFDIVYNSWW